MIILAAETSTLLGSVALLKDGVVLATEESMRQGSHSDVLNVFIQKVLDKTNIKLSDIDFFVTGIGPGSFTGIRISLNAIKTMAYCHKKPTFGLSSLASLATAADSTLKSSEFDNLPIVSMVNAYKNMCYVATYQKQNSNLIELKKPEVIRVQNLENYITQKSVICGDAYLTYEKFFSENLKEKLVRNAATSDESHAKTLALMAHENLKNNKPASAWNELLPLYLRSSEAEENLQGIKYQPLF